MAHGSLGVIFIGPPCHFLSLQSAVLWGTTVVIPALRMGHGGCSVVTALWSGVRRVVDRYGPSQFVAAWTSSFPMASPHAKYFDG